MLWATSYLCDMLSIERFDGDCRQIYAFRGTSCYVVQREDSLGSLYTS